MSAPSFGPEDARWTIGSEVLAHTWTRTKAGAVEVAVEAVVSGLTRGGPEGWTVTVSFGPLLDTALTRELAPSQIEAL